MANLAKRICAVGLLALTASVVEVPTALAVTSPGAAQRTSRRAAPRMEYLVPSNTRIVGELNTRLNAATARRGQRFTLHVASPDEYQGATITGHIADAKRSGRVKGKSEMSLAFDTIRLRNGQMYRFGGDVESVRTHDGDDFDIGDEGEISKSQTDRTVGRTAIGAVAGTIIGAIAGGGSGAAAGAAVGGGLGAGSVLVQGRRTLDLRPGTKLTIRSYSPARR